MERKSFIKCCNCGEHMDIDDIEYNFKGNKNEWLYCEKCKINCYAEIRFNQLFRIKFEQYNEETDDYTIIKEEKFKIDRSK